jgi:hypothetical protein
MAAIAGLRPAPAPALRVYYRDMLMMDHDPEINSSKKGIIRQSSNIRAVARKCRQFFN